MLFSTKFLLYTIDMQDLGMKPCIDDKIIFYSSQSPELGAFY